MGWLLCSSFCTGRKVNLNKSSTNIIKKSEIVQCVVCFTGQQTMVSRNETETSNKNIEIMKRVVMDI